MWHATHFDRQLKKLRKTLSKQSFATPWACPGFFFAGGGRGFKGPPLFNICSFLRFGANGSANRSVASHEANLVKIDRRQKENRRNSVE